MLLVKSYVAQVVHCLNDEDETVSELAKLFFTSLASRDQRLYNALPDIISRLTDPQTRQHPEQKEKADENFKTALEYLLQYIEKDKHFDALFEQITRRVIKSPDKRNLLELAFCLSQIKSITNKGARTLSKIASENKDEIQKALGVKAVYEAYKKLLCGIKGTTDTTDDQAPEGSGNEALQLINSLRDHADQENRAVDNAVKAVKAKQLKSRKKLKAK